MLWGDGKGKKALSFKESAVCLGRRIHTHSGSRFQPGSCLCFYTRPHLALECFSEAVFSSLCSQGGKALRGDVLVQGHMVVVAVVELSPTPSPSGPKLRSLWPMGGGEAFLVWVPLKAKLETRTWVMVVELGCV